MSTNERHGYDELLSFHEPPDLDALLEEHLAHSDALDTAAETLGEDFDFYEWFCEFDPVATFARNVSGSFIQRRIVGGEFYTDAIRCAAGGDALNSLWAVAARSYARLRSYPSSEALREALAYRYASFTENLRMTLYERVIDGRHPFVHPDGSPADARWFLECSRPALVAMIWQASSGSLHDMKPETRSSFREDLSLSCLLSVDHGIGELLRGRTAVPASMIAAECDAAASMIQLHEAAARSARQQLAHRAAVKRHSGGPAARDKRMVFECWRAWKADPPRYSGKAEFARDMLQKCEHIKSQKSIEDWTRQWEAGGQA